MFTHTVRGSTLDVYPRAVGVKILMSTIYSVLFWDLVAFTQTNFTNSGDFQPRSVMNCSSEKQLKVTEYVNHMEWIETTVICRPTNRL